MSGSKKAAFLMGAVLAMAVNAKAALAEDAPTDQDNSVLSRVTLAIPFFTHHFPHDQAFDDHNWGGILFYALDDQFSLAGGDFINSYRRNTAFAGASWTPFSFDLSYAQIGLGGVVGLDLNGGYDRHNSLEPLLAAATIKISGNYFEEPNAQFLNRLGLLVTLIPGVGPSTSTALNFALTVRL